MIIANGWPPWNELVIVTNHTMALREEHYLYITTLSSTRYPRKRVLDKMETYTLM
jgi:hypothetical protein